jgi:hypothetical protein
MSGHLRQMFWCHPADGSPPHRFADLLPRAVVPEHACAECLTDLNGFEGPPHARNYEFSARQVAAGLLSLGLGKSYRSTADTSRRTMGRFRRNKPRGVGSAPVPYGANDKPAAGWAEVFAPIVAAPHLPAAWPDVVAFDDLPFAGIDHTKRGKSGRGGKPLFAVLGAYGYTTAGASDRLWLLRAAPTPSVASIKVFLRLLPGTPRVVVCDPAWAWNRAIREVWPAPNTPEIVWSEHHLAKTLRAILTRNGCGDKSHPLAKALGSAFLDARGWTAFEAEARRWGVRELDGWMRRRGPQVAAQVANHAVRRVPRTTGGLETALGTVKTRLRQRRGLFGNLDRMDRLLELMLLDLIGVADERRYAAAIREHLLKTRGRPGTRQAARNDRRGTASLLASGRR